MIYFLFIVLFVYVVFISLLIFGFTKMKVIPYEEISVKTKFSIVVPFRNEAENLPKLLQSISLLNYPIDFYEVILVDDDSEKVFSFQQSVFSLSVIKNFRKSNSPKKDAIETAIKLAKYDWILTTDADCLVDANWLKSLDNFIQQTNKKMVVAGVSYVQTKGFLHAFQNLDFLSLQGATIGSFGINQPFMCNGANFAYKKELFYELNGFEGNSTIASGDDVFLLQKAVKKEANSIGFSMNYDSIVKTKSLESAKGLFFQRVRWASKSTGYSSVFGKSLAFVVFLGNLGWIITFVLCLLNLVNYTNFIIYFGIKFLVDFILLAQATNFFKTKIKWVLISSIVYPFISCAVAFYSLIGTYEWKGRKFRK